MHSKLCIFTIVVAYVAVLTTLTNGQRQQKCSRKTENARPENGYKTFPQNFEPFQENEYEYVEVPLWPNGEVPYVFDVDRNDEAHLREAFDGAVEEFHKHTCIKFVERGYQPNYLHVITDENNYADLGMKQKKTTLSVTCAEEANYLKYKYLHYLGRILGLPLEHQRRDRHQYIDLHKKKIYPGFEYLFQMKRYSTSILSYDFNSFLQYPGYAFAKNFSDPVITTKNPKYQSNLGQMHGFSKCDIVKLNFIYNCVDKNRNVSDCYGNTFPEGCKDVGCRCNDAVAQNFCEIYPGLYKLRKCMKSCNNCGKDCHDTRVQYLYDLYCAGIRSSTDCTREQKEICPRSCDMCDVFMV